MCVCMCVLMYVRACLLASFLPCLLACLVGWLVGRSVGRSVGWLVGWLVVVVVFCVCLCVCLCVFVCVCVSFVCAWGRFSKPLGFQAVLLVESQAGERFSAMFSGRAVCWTLGNPLRYVSSWNGLRDNICEDDTWVPSGSNSRDPWFQQWRRLVHGCVSNGQTSQWLEPLHKGLVDVNPHRIWMFTTGAPESPVKVTPRLLLPS